MRYPNDHNIHHTSLHHDNSHGLCYGHAFEKAGWGMKKVKAILMAMTILSIGYLAFAFIMDSLDPTDWGQVARAICAIISVFSSAILTASWFDVIETKEQTQ